MSKTTEASVQDGLRYEVDEKQAGQISCNNHTIAESAGYFLKTKWKDQVNPTSPTTYYDSVSGLPLFCAPVGRTFKEFLEESEIRGWLSFRDSEVLPNRVRVLPNGECVSYAGTHLGRNMPDKKGNRYSINLVSIAGNPTKELQVAYWGIRGLGAPLRMMCEYKGIEYTPVLYTGTVDEKTKYDLSCWFKDGKPGVLAKNPFANLPYIIDEEEDICICQTNACFDYLGRKLGLDGKDDTEQLKCDQCLDQVMDMRNQMVKVFYGPGFEKKKDGFIDSLAGHYTKFENWLSHHGTLYLSSDDELCSADFHLWELLDQMEMYAKDFQKPSPLKGKENLSKFYSAIRANDQLKGYFEGDLYKLPVNNLMANWK